MSNKFTGITSGGQEIPVYDKSALHDAYSAGNNIGINGNVISVTGRKSLAVQSPLSAEVSGNSVIISLDESAIDVSSKLDTSAFAEVSGSFLTSGDLDGYATEGFVESAVSGKADTSAIPSLDGYATEQWVGEQGYLTEVPAGYATTEDVQAATSGLQPSGDYASASDLTNYQPVSAMTAYQAAGDYLSGNALDSLSGTWETVTAKLDASAYSSFTPTSESGTILINGSNFEGTTSAIKTIPGEETLFASGVTNTGGTYPGVWNNATRLVASASSNSQWICWWGPTDDDWNQVTLTAGINEITLPDKSQVARGGALAGNGASISAYSASEPSTVIVELAEKNDLSAYQPAGSYLSANALDSVSGDWNEVSAKLDTTAFSDVSGSFLTSVPDTYLQNTDLTVVDNKITEISGVQLSAGTELEFEYDSADNISAINNSAISTTPSQALYAKSPLYAGISGTSSFIGFEASAVSADLARMLGVDETVLWTNDTLTKDVNWNNQTLSENISAFNKVKFLYRADGGGSPQFLEFPVTANNDIYNCFAYREGGSNMQLYVRYATFSINGTELRNPYNLTVNEYFNGDVTAQTNNDGYNYLYKVVGIGRKA